MIQHTPYKKLALAGLAILISVVQLSAMEIVYLKNGDIVFGSLIGPVQDGVAYRSFGKERVLALDSIALTEKNLTNLSKTPVRVILKDGSTIQGIIVDYDDDIGLFLDISFGTLTLPGNAIEAVYDLERKTRYAGSPLQVSAYGGFYVPFGDATDYFGSSWNAGAGAAWALPFVRGLYGGARLTVYGVDYTPDSSVKYTMLSIRPEVTWKYLGWRSGSGLLSKFVPYALFGAGPVYIAIEDPSAYPSNYGSISAEIALAAGVEYAVSKQFVAKLETGGTTVFQKDSAFTFAGLALSISYER